MKSTYAFSSVLASSIKFFVVNGEGLETEATKS